MGQYQVLTECVYLKYLKLTQRCKSAVCAQSLSGVRLLASPWSVTCQTPLSHPVGFCPWRGDKIRKVERGQATGVVLVLESDEPGLTSGPWPPSTASPGTGDFSPPSSHGRLLHKGRGVDDGRLTARGCPPCSLPLVWFCPFLVAW